MTRVSQNSAAASLNYSLGRAKRKLEDLQLKGATLKQISRPSDGAVANVEALAIGSRVNDNIQYLQNGNYALMNLGVTEQALEQLSDIINRVKELAIAQSSDTFTGKIRRGIATEVRQLYDQALAVANKRIGKRYIFAGFKTLTTPFDSNGNYLGDNGRIRLEIAKDFFVDASLNGREVFHSPKDGPAMNKGDAGSLKLPEIPIDVEGKEESIDISEGISRGLASSGAAEVEGVEGQWAASGHNSIFSQIDRFASALEINNAAQIRALLPELDDSLNRIIILRTKIGSLEGSIHKAREVIEKENVSSLGRKSKLEDADVVKLFSDLERQKGAMKASYQISNNMINKTLLDFLR